MIPTMIVLGILFGRWWIAAIIGGGLFWGFAIGAMSVIANDETFSWGLILGAVLLGAVNAAFGAGIHQLVLWIIRKIRSARKTPTR
ncbi:hypothetical protein CQ018_08910 [Arthrobacter sp. MYb227]|uniref:hypothetical protein n=1 Tax=Arthrobacter sp. MYb227 TaxID=1848601 RepID=UPI000D473585|nr:hypothetical protein [Arthrobacter sp. MYb227]PQZ93763.1 hypothetical protein CQ018_08910 [Arthrobacter sp. MYb227]